MRDQTAKIRAEADLALRYALTKSPGFAGVALWVRYEARADRDAVAATDGKRVLLWPGFLRLSKRARIAAIVHEVLHVAFRHVAKARKLPAAVPNAPLLFNVAADAVINREIARHRWMEVPRDWVRIEEVLPEDLLQAKPAKLWTAEQIFRVLASDPDLTARVVERFGSGPRDLAEAAEDLGADAGGDAEDRLWRDRLLRAQAGDRPGGLLRELGAEFPVVETDWRPALNRFLNAACRPTTEAEWSRPGRHYLALGCRGPWRPAVRPARGAKRLVFILDTSRSITADLLALFLASVNEVQRLTGCEILLVQADAAVRDVELLRGPLPPDLKVYGGGGTDFRPPLEFVAREAARYGGTAADIAAVVFLTDLYGPLPETPPPFARKLLWGVVSDLTAPWGQTLRVR